MTFFRELAQYRSFLLYAVYARLRSEVSNSYLNWIWWLLEPLMDMIVYIIVFGWFFHMQEDYFPVFLFIGISMWNFFSKSIRGSVGLVKRNKDIITRIYIPKSILLLRDILINFVKMCLSFAIIAVMTLFYRIPLRPSLLWGIPLVILLILNTYGVCCFFLHFGVYYEDLEYVVSILLNIMMYFTGIFYSIERVLPEPWGYILSRFNPAAFLIISMRNALLHGRAPAPEGIIFALCSGLILSFFGLRHIRKYENQYIKVI